MRLKWEIETEGGKRKRDKRGRKREEREIENNIEVLKLLINIERSTDRLPINSKRLMLVLFETNCNNILSPEPKLTKKCFFYS